MGAGIALSSTTWFRKFVKTRPLFHWINSPPLRRLDAALFNLRHHLLSPGELGDGAAVRQVKLFDPMGLATDAEGNIYVSDRGIDGPGRVVWRLGLDGKGVILAGNGRRGVARGSQPAREASLGSPQGICVDPSGRVYLADSYNHLVVLIDTDGTLQHVAGSGSPGNSGDGGPARAARLNQPYDVRVDPEGSLYIADYGNHRIRKITPDGIIHTVAGTGLAGYSGDGGKAVAARLNGPYGVYFSDYYGLLIADSQNHVIRLVDRQGYISTVAGTGRAGFGGDGGAARQATFSAPQALYVIAPGRILVSDEHNHAIRIIEPDGMVRRLAGTGRPGFSPDGISASEAALSDPENLLALQDGRLLFTEAGNRRLRSIDADGILRTLAGGSR